MSVLIALVFDPIVPVCVRTAPACVLIGRLFARIVPLSARIVHLRVLTDPLRDRIVQLFARIVPVRGRIALPLVRIVRQRVRNALQRSGPVLELAARPISSARRRGHSDLRLVHKQGRNNNSGHGRNRVRVRSSGPGLRVVAADNAGIAHRAPGRIDDDNFLR